MRLSMRKILPPHGEAAAQPPSNHGQQAGLIELSV
jgi:hypothetical protein